MKKILMIAAAAAVCFAACSKNEGGVPGDRTLRITPTIGNPSLTPAAMTASTRATDTDFELGDKVGLKVTMTADGKDFVSNKPMTFDGTDFKTEGFLWYEDINATSTLFAYYPWQEGGDIPAEFSVKADRLPFLRNTCHCRSLRLSNLGSNRKPGKLNLPDSRFYLTL